ncbi:MAG: hypothetical protein IM507_17030 [Microcystis sp. M20BS1]|jgi:hypothetical protein|uniref:Uncharacterized protein n=1 Tax=Microcystis aeruginosa NIES-4285 TaxID=2497681 RepID=A0A402DBQ4_MICAE|nr:MULTISPECIES: hypothetical protein [Microcystis]MCA2623065.1 hypothetical protein [Microcystis sp. M19BS1]MCA2634025.1 hypothetical protein [Microcystis sp. M20BS1]ROI02439.1 hypothetical protein ED562_13070 [Microcystis aeruginosa FACHB-524]GCE59598.1 hypothetical protein MiAbB_01516 [Microcystis aeruginosa NIES-4285]
MAIHLLPFAAKLTMGAVTAYITFKGCQATAKKINELLDKRYPNVKFRLNATIVDWSVKLVRSTISSMLAEDKKGEIKKQLQALSIDAWVELLRRIIKDAFNGGNAPNGTESEDLSEEELIIDVIASAAYTYFLEEAVAN